MDTPDEAHRAPRLSLYCCGRAIMARLYAALWWVELAHHRRPWITRLFLPLVALFVLWRAFAEPATQLSATLSPAACAALLHSKGTPALPVPDSKQSLADALTTAAADRKRVVLVESRKSSAVLTQNWIKHSAALKPPLHNHLVVALDRHEFGRLSELGVHTYYEAPG